MSPEEFEILDRGKSKPVRYAHEFRYCDLPNEDLPDVFGRLLRANDLPLARWSQWLAGMVSAIKKGLVSPEVQSYYMTHRGGIRPPQEVNPEAPRFTWSPSKLMTFETCPMKLAAESYYKTVPYEESVQAVWGTRVHKAAEDFFNEVENDDTEAFKVVEAYCSVLGKLPGERLVEYKIALDDKWQPAEWDAGCARMILDLGIISPDGKTLRAFDWKTGKMKDSLIQMQIYCYALAILFPNIETFDMKYVWLKDRKTTGFVLKRSELLPVAKDIRERVKRMKLAWDTENFPMRKNGLCKQWCGALDCAYCGRGR